MMRPRQLRRQLTLTFVAVTIIGSALGTGIAKADPVSDTAYLSTLDHFAVPYSTEGAVIDAGHAICDAFDSGLTFRRVGAIAMSSGFTAEDAGHLIGAAVGSYCDQYIPLLRGEAAGTVRA